MFTPQLPASSQLVRTFRYSRIELNQLQLVIRVNSRYTFADSEASEKDHRKPVLEHDRLLAATVPAKLDAGSIGNDVTTTGIVLASLAGCHSEWGQDRSAKNTFIRPAATFSRPREQGFIRIQGSHNPVNGFSARWRHGSARFTDPRTTGISWSVKA